MALLTPPCYAAEPPPHLELLLHAHTPTSSLHTSSSSLFMIPPCTASTIIHSRGTMIMPSHCHVSSLHVQKQWPFIRIPPSKRTSSPCKYVSNPNFCLSGRGKSTRSTGNAYEDAIPSPNALSAAGKLELLLEHTKSQGGTFGDDSGRNSGHGGLGGNGGDDGYGDFSSFGPEDHARNPCYALAIIMMDLQGLCNDIISEGDFSAHSCLLSNLKVMLSSWFSCLLSYHQGHVKPSNEYVDMNDSSNSSVTMIGFADEEESDVNGAIFQADVGYTSNYSDDVIIHGEHRENMGLQKIEHGRDGSLWKEHTDNDRAYEALVSKSAVISWFTLHALAKVSDDQATSAEPENVNMKEPRTMTEGLCEDSPTQLQGPGGDFTAAKKSDLEIMKRLQREVFSDLMKIRERLDKIEQTRWPSDRQGGAKTQLKGEAKAGVALVLLDDTSNSQKSRDALVNAGMQSGLDTSFTFETRFRERDSLIIQCVSGQGSSISDGGALGGPLALGKLQYVTHLNDDFSLSFVPLGAQGKDVTEIINVLQGKGVTSFSSQGPALFNHCRGSAVGATVSGSMFAFSFGQYLSGWSNYTSTAGRVGNDSGDPLCLSTLGQFLIQPIEGIVVSLSGLGQYWPSPPLPSSMGLHWSEMGPLVIPKLCPWKKRQPCIDYTDPLTVSISHNSSPRSHLESAELEYGTDSLECKGTSSFSFALASSMDLSENTSISAWAQIEKGDSLQDVENGNIQWAINLSKISESGIEWGASIGSSRSSPFCWDSDHNNSQLQLEAFLRVECGKGFTLQPGFLYVSNQSTQTPAFIIKSNWSL